MTRRPFTFIFPYYENPVMLLRQYAAIAALPPDVRSALHVIVVDDGSPKTPASPPLEAYTTGDVIPEYADEAAQVADSGRRRLGIASFQLFRVEVDVRWNWLTCRNIAAHHAKTDWLLMTDIDHQLPEATARRIQEKKLDPAKTYRFSRVDAPGMTSYKPHPNSWLFTGERFDRIGGYDERFSGFYGTASAPTRRRWKCWTRFSSGCRARSSPTHLRPDTAARKNRITKALPASAPRLRARAANRSGFPSPITRSFNDRGLFSDLRG